jgi:hypothetical protein
VAQSYSSAATSIKQVPALIRQMGAQLGPLNLDLGGGRFNLSTDHLAGVGVESLVFDPYNRTTAHNDAVQRRITDAGGADTVTVCNVLNVIAEAGARHLVITAARRFLRRGGTALFSVHEGSKRDRDLGPRSTGKDKWQNFWPTKAYLTEIRQVFPRASTRGKIIIAPT